MISVTLNTGAVVTEPFVESLQKMRTYGFGLIRVPRPNDTDPKATGPGRATFRFDVKRDVDGGPVEGFFRNPNGTIRIVVFSGACHNELPQCRFAVTVIEALDEKLGVIVTGALNEVRSRRAIVCTVEKPDCFIRIAE
jgi:hypothetical protein